MFKKILIANRGEIAIRIAKTARRMGISTVAVYSDADKDALHVATSDEAYCIGASTPTESYLNIERVIDAAVKSGSEAVHPGYGFLSENPDFPEALERTGLVFIGPSAESIRAMGLKSAAKRLMTKANVPIVPGYHGSDQRFITLKAEANSIGYPLLIKAVAGGGGKGMRLVEDPENFSEALHYAQSEATNAFDNSHVLLEKYISAPRHIEVQVFGDGEKTIHLFERDCSLQRRYQKVIEEAPAPGITEPIRAAICDAAIRAAEAIDYKGAGTVEFIADGSNGLRQDKFWFLEMNTRLQVEHPVTEAVTGVDIVEWQLRVSAGEKLPLEQDDLHLNGHAIEARVYAEDAANGFLPVTGRLDHVRFADRSRNDCSVQSGDQINPFYDPMIGKVIVHEKNRSEALTQLSAALRETELAGSKTNLSFLIDLAEHSDFAKFAIDTNWIDRNVKHLVQTANPSVNALLSAVLAAVHVGRIKGDLLGFNLWSPLKQAVKLRFNDYISNLSVSFDRNTAYISDKNSSYIAQQRNGLWWHREQRLPLAKAIGSSVWVFEDGGIIFELCDPLYREGKTIADAASVLAPMPGLVTHVAVKKGQRLQKGDKIVVLEAMKMEHGLAAPGTCEVEEVKVSAGDQVEAAAELVRLKIVDDAT
ncbi:MAG: 3-methylcrotonyl-CoA carboxylase [Rhodobacteraceae bacterium]|nr:3-methylcrotonyl-CoA carboxylase [Paracoccaceae bacterium]